MSQVVIIKLPKGTQAPPGYTLVRSLRNGDIYHKMIPVISDEQLVELSHLFADTRISAIVLPVSEEDEFLAKLSTLSLSGGRKSRKMKKLRKHKRTKRGNKH
jgi:hypothetical protein